MEWKNHPITKLFLKLINERIEDMKEELTVSSERIEYRQGYIQAARDISGFKAEDDNAS